MAKIENTKVYPTVIPAMDDLLIATDVSDNNATVTFLVSSLVGGTGVLQGLQSVLTTGNTAIEDINLTGNITVIGTVAPTTITALGSTGLLGQILSSTATGLQWINSPSTSCCTWNDSLIAGNTSTTKSVVDGVGMEFINAGGNLSIQSPATLNSSGINTFTGEVRINGTDINFNPTGQINDGAGATGTAGQWLTSTGTGLAWSSTIPPSSCCDIQNTLAAGSIAFNQGMEFSGTSSVLFGAGVSIGSAGNNVFSGTNTFNGVVEINACLEDSLGTCGVAGQVLISTGAGVTWSTGAGIGAQDLQGVLDTGNTASGANANITISGTVNPGSITDGTGSLGAAGQVLSWNGVSLSWINSATAGVSDIALSPSLFNTTAINTGALITNVAGSTSTLTLLKYSGGADIGIVPEGGTASTFLRGDGTWVTPGGGGGAVTSISSATTGVSSTGNAITPNSLATGAVVLNLFEYAGDTNVGYVPRGGNNNTNLFLNGTGNWSTPGGGGAVTSVSAGVAGTSTGTPLTITPTTGAVVATSNAFAGTSNVGHVPDSTPYVQTTNFLRADGQWAVPGGGNSYINDYKIWAQKLVPNPTTLNTYCTFGDTTTFGSGFQPDLMKIAVSTVAPSSGPGWTVTQQFSGHLIGNGSKTGCNSGDTKAILCGIHSTFQCFNTGTYEFALWKGDICSGTTPTFAASTSISVVVANVPICSTWVIPATPPQLTGTEFYFLTFRTTSISVGNNTSYLFNMSVQQELV